MKRSTVAMVAAGALVAGGGTVAAINIAPRTSSDTSLHGTILDAQPDAHLVLAMPPEDLNKAAHLANIKVAPAAIAKATELSGYTPSATGVTVEWSTSKKAEIPTLWVLSSEPMGDTAQGILSANGLVVRKFGRLAAISSKLGVLDEFSEPAPRADIEAPAEIEGSWKASSLFALQDKHELLRTTLADSGLSDASVVKLSGADLDNLTADLVDVSEPKVPVMAQPEQDTSEADGEEGDSDEDNFVTFGGPREPAPEAQGPSVEPLLVVSGVRDGNKYVIPVGYTGSDSEVATTWQVDMSGFMQVAEAVGMGSRVLGLKFDSDGKAAVLSGTVGDDWFAPADQVLVPAPEDGPDSGASPSGD